MTDALKEKIIIRFIKNYKNRTGWSDEYVKENYSDAIEYMIEKFESMFNYSDSTSSNSNSALPNNNIKKITQGPRTHEYYQNNSTLTDNSFNNVVNSDPILLALLGRPFINEW